MDVRNGLFSVIIACCLQAVVACSDKNRELIAGIEILKSEPIVLPCVGEAELFGSDSSFCDFSACELKVVVFTDSAECSTCMLKRWGEWERLVAWDREYEGRVKFYFIFEPSQKNAYLLPLVLENSRVNYPVFIDRERFFRKSNPHIPDKSIFHVFLLDSRDSVVAVGSPLFNERMEVLMKEEIRDLLK